MSRRAPEPGPTHPTRPRRAGPATCPAARRSGEYRAPKSRREPEGLLVVLPGARARLQLRPGTTTKACPPARSRRNSAPTPPGSARPGRSAASAAPRPGTRRCCATRCTCWPPAGSKRGHVARPGANAARTARAAGHARPVLADHAGRGEDALQGTGQAPPSGRQWRRPRRRGTPEDHQSGLCRGPLAAGAPRPAWRPPGEPEPDPPLTAIASCARWRGG